MDLPRIRCINLIVLLGLTYLSGTIARTIFDEEDSSGHPYFSDTGNGTIPEATDHPRKNLQNSKIAMGVVGFLALFCVSGLLYKELRDRRRQGIIDGYNRMRTPSQVSHVLAQPQVSTAQKQSVAPAIMISEEDSPLRIN